MNSAQDNELVKHLKAALEAYYRWARAHPTTLLYEINRMDEHSALLGEYFAE